MTSYDAWCAACNRVTAHNAGACQECVTHTGRPGGGRFGQPTRKPVTMKTVALIGEALRRKLAVDPDVFDEVVEYVLENDPRMRRRTTWDPML